MSPIDLEESLVSLLHETVGSASHIRLTRGLCLPHYTRGKQISSCRIEDHIFSPSPRPEATSMSFPQTRVPEVSPSLYRGHGGGRGRATCFHKTMSAFSSTPGPQVGPVSPSPQTGRAVSPPADGEGGVSPIRPGGRHFLHQTMRVASPTDQEGSISAGPAPPGSPLSSSCRTTGKLAWDTE